MADITAIADAVTSALSGANLGQPFTAVRTFAPSYDPVKQEGIRIFVVPIAQTFDNSTRSDTLRTSTIMIGIYNAIGFDEYGSHSTDELDGMLTFTEKVCDWFLSNGNVENPDAFVIDVANDPTFDPQTLDHDNVFATVVTLKYQLIR